jgi:hypothetical protein
MLTRLGTDASLAGDHTSVSTSRSNEATNRPNTESTNGSVPITRPRPMSQITMTFLRSQRSTSTPPTEARKKPGIIRALMTRATDASGDEPPTRAARARMATRPIQSPREETTCATHRRKNELDPRSLNRPGSSGDSSPLPLTSRGSVSASPFDWFSRSAGGTPGSVTASG